MQLDQPGRSQYERLADDLRAKIVDGTYAVGSSLPSMRELMSGNGVSQTVVRDALRILKNERIVEGQAGKGVYVTRVPEPREEQPTYDEVVEEVRGIRELLGELTKRVAQVEERIDSTPPAGRPS